MTILGPPGSGVLHRTTFSRSNSEPGSGTEAGTKGREPSVLSAEQRCLPGCLKCTERKAPICSVISGVEA